MSEFITQLFTSCQELTKYYVIRNVVTGDKTLDNLLSATILLLVGYAFKVDLWKKIYNNLATKFHDIFSKSLGKISSKKPEVQEPTNITYYEGTKFIKVQQIDHEEYLKTYFNIALYNKITWNTSEQKFDTALNYFINKEHPHLVKKVYIKMDSDLSISNMQTKVNLHHLYGSRSTQIIYTPLLLYNNELIVICQTLCENDIYIYYKSKETLQLFRNLVLTYMPDSIHEEKIDTSEGQEIYRIDYTKMNIKETGIYVYKNRNINTYISRYKSQIVSLLENFKSINAIGKTSFNNYGNYNLGFMVYGNPGCGKTLLTKVLSNYLERNLVIVDMRKIKTKSQFEGLFYNIKKRIFIFDEFDCIQGVLSRNISTENKDNTYIDKGEKQTLKQCRFDTLMTLHQTIDEKMREEIKKSIEEIDKKIYQLEDQLTLDTILTVLDGVEEVRGRVIVANTNYIDRIDTALLREGRFDIKLHLTEFNNDEIKELLCQMFNDKESHKIIHSHTYQENKFSPTVIMNICFQHNDLLKVIHILKV